MIFHEQALYIEHVKQRNIDKRCPIETSSAANVRARDGDKSTVEKKIPIHKKKFSPPWYS